tara:strand:- start:1141 stop:1812 length:672 start_codon:yes stop_codon:yes gene_type:complete
MAFAPVTIPGGTILATNPGGQGAQDNLDKMKDYIDGAVATADIATDGWVQAKHVMRGHYNPITNMHTFATGLDGGYSSERDEMSFVGDGPTGRGAPTNTVDMNFSNTGMSFFLRSAADIMFQFTAYPITPSINLQNVSPLTRATVYIDGVKSHETQMATRHITDLSSHQTSDFWLAHNFNVWSGFFISKNLGEGEHTITIRGETEGRYSFLMNFSVSLEAFYR